MKGEILLICPDIDLSQKVVKILNRDNYTVTHVADITRGIGKIYDSQPVLVILYEPLIKDKKPFCDFKRDNIFSHIPVILLVTPEWEMQEISWHEYPVDDYMTTSLKSRELKNRVSLSLSRFSREMDPNPLTRLPGNTSILRAIQNSLDSDRRDAISYVDMDNFKSFNDKYGFARGDEAIRMTARILSNVIQDYHDEGAFLGHVGGDDFVFIMPLSHIDTACQKIIESFDSIIVSLYDTEDRERGFIIASDRSGKKQQFPIMSISIAVVTNAQRKIKHYGEAAEIASEVKKYVKRIPKSNYMLDRRRQ